MATSKRRLRLYVASFFLAFIQQGAGCAAQRSSLLVTTSTEFIEIAESPMQRGLQRYLRRNNVSVNTVERPC